MKHKIRTAVFLSALAIGILHLINRFVASAAIIKNMLNADIGRYFNWRFGKIFYTKSGQGTPLLLIHDTSPFSSSYEWREIVKKLSKTHTVYALDLLGCGRSDKPNMTYTNFLYVQLVTDFVQQVIGQKTDVTATGISGSFVIMACHNNQDLFNKILLVNPESLTKLSSIPGKRSKITKVLMDLPIIGTAIYNMIVNKENLEYFFTEKYIYNPFRLHNRYIDTYYESAHLKDCQGKYLLSSLNGFYLNANINHALKEIDNSIFIINGGKCEEADLITEHYLEMNPAIESISIKDTKHLPQIEVPEVFLDQLNIFLS